MKDSDPHPVEAARTQGTRGKAIEPSGPLGDDPSTAGPGATGVVSNTPENDQGHINPSAPEDANTTPRSTTDK